MYGLQPLLEPLSREEFVRECHGQRARLIEGEPGKFGELCGWSDITHLLNHGGLQFPTAKFVLNKEPLGAESLQQADYWLRQGATLIINSMQRLDPVVEHFADALGRDMNTRININAYTSWPSKQGFDCHFDRHDVFIVQLEGSKTWKVFEPTQPFPLELNKGSVESPPDSDPYLACRMTPGDVMYIPRGHWHYAVAESPSVHLTVGPSSRSGIDFLNWLTYQLLERNQFLRRDFPVVDSKLLGGSLDDTALFEHIRLFREVLQDALDEETLTNDFIQFCMTTNPAQRFCPLPDYVTLLEDWDPDTRFMVNPAQKALLRYDADGSHATVVVRGHILNLEEVPEALIERLFGDVPVLTGRDLLEVAPDLKWKKLRPFLLRLFEIGVIMQADDSA